MYKLINRKIIKFIGIDGYKISIENLVVFLYIDNNLLEIIIEKIFIF